MRRLIEDRLGALSAARAAMATTESFRAEVMRLEWSLKLLELEDNERRLKWPVPPADSSPGR